MEYIGVVDSGVGGLDILKVLIKEFNHENFYYIGDNLNLPYGAKTKEQLEQYGIVLAQYLEAQGAKMIVIACNTLSLNAIEIMREHVSIPIYGIVRPTIKGMLNHKNIKHVLVLATQATVNSHRYVDFLNELDQDVIVYQQVAPKLVDYIEGNKIALIDDAIKEYVDIYQKKIDGIILGCTHYPIVRDHFIKLYPHLEFFDSRQQMKQLVKEKLNELNMKASINNKQVIKIHASKSISDLKSASEHFFNYDNVQLLEGGIFLEQ
jgi:glutamate racemase